MRNIGPSEKVGIRYVCSGLRNVSGFDCPISRRRSRRSGRLWVWDGRVLRAASCKYACNRSRVITLLPLFFSWKKGRGNPLNVSLTVPLLLQRVLPSAGRKVEIKERCSQARQEGKGNAHQNGHSRRRTLGKNAYFFTLRAHGKRYITFTFFGFFFFY